MQREFSGKLDATGLKMSLVVGRWNHFITDRLVEGATDAFVRHGGKPEDLSVVRCPGSFEIPAVLARLVKSKACGDMVVCLSTLIRGDTPHFDYISAEVTKGIAAVSMESKVPVTYGVLTCDTLEQAVNRAGVKSGNKGFEAAMAAIEMANLYKLL